MANIKLWNKLVEKGKESGFELQNKSEKEVTFYRMVTGEEDDIVNFWFCFDGWRGAIYKKYSGPVSHMSKAEAVFVADILTYLN